MADKIHVLDTRVVLVAIAGQTAYINICFFHTQYDDIDLKIRQVLYIYIYIFFFFSFVLSERSSDDPMSNDRHAV